MISKNAIKHIRSLSLKKFREATGTFIAEGPKVVSDLLPIMKCEQLYLTPEGMELATRNQWFGPQAAITPEAITQEELERMSLLKSPHAALGVFSIPSQPMEEGWIAEWAGKHLCLALDGVQDPGNLGTIIRIADWFGIEHIFASPDTADAFAPKVVQATMGAIARIHIHYLPLPHLLQSLPAEVPVYGTFLNGDNIYNKEIKPHGIIVMGNEGKGISAEASRSINQRLFIPNYPADRPTSESLNVAVATAIICAEFRRRG